MQRFTLPLIKGIQRPVVFLKDLRIGAMLDTGALYPVWNYTEAYLRGLGGVQIGEGYRISGLGGETFGKLYSIPNFKLGELIYPNFHIVATPQKIPCHMLISATMFEGLIYQIDTRRRDLTITIPDEESHIRNLKIYDKNGYLHISVTGNSVDRLAHL